LTAAQTTLTADVASGALTLHLAPTSGCPAGVNLCRFAPGMTALVFDDTGAFGTFTIATIAAAASQLAVNSWSAGSSAYSAGAAVVEAQVHTYYVKTDLVTKNPQLMLYD